jgi:hypothetical protein
MKTNTFKPEMVGDSIMPPLGEINVKVWRANGRGGWGLKNEKVLKNVVTRAGLNRIANRAVQATGTSPFYVLGVGTQNAVHSLDSGQGGIGETLRKSSNFSGATAQSREWIFLQATIGGSSDSMTGVQLESVFMTDYPNSSNATGIIAAVTNGLGVNLANSDLLDLTYRVRVGSHNVSHST